MDFKLVFIDDNLSMKEPLIQHIRIHFDIEDYNVFQDPEEGLEYVLNNLNKRMIVFIDRNFDGYSKQGLNLLKEIRNQTSLLYIVMMSANPLSDISVSSQDLIEMMNSENFFYFDRSNGSFEDVDIIINSIKKQWSVKFDCVLEDWLLRHPEDNKKEAFTETDSGKKYTWEDILIELRQQTAIGKSFEKKLNQYYIHLLNRSKK